jgi:hypothetical protein
MQMPSASSAPTKSFFPSIFYAFDPAHALGFARHTSVTSGNSGCRPPPQCPQILLSPRPIPLHGGGVARGHHLHLIAHIERRDNSLISPPSADSTSFGHPAAAVHHSPSTSIPTCSRANVAYYNKVKFLSHFTYFLSDLLNTS